MRLIRYDPAGLPCSTTVTVSRSNRWRVLALAARGLRVNDDVNVVAVHRDAQRLRTPERLVGDDRDRDVGVFAR